MLDIFDTSSRIWPALVFIGSGVVFLTLIMTSLVLSGYLVLDPRLLAPPRFNDSAEPVEVIVGGTALAIPANYVRSRGGDNVILHALLPDFAPYRLDNRLIFEAAGDDYSPLVQISLQPLGLTYRAEHRLEILYNKHIIPEPEGAGPAGLTAYQFKPEAGRDYEQLYSAEDNSGHPALILCFRYTAAAPAPMCRRTFLITDTLAATYEFKRGQLDKWQEMADQIRELVGRFGSSASEADQTRGNSGGGASGGNMLENNAARRYARARAYFNIANN